MRNETSICNQALAHLSIGSITSLQESSESARKCLQFYEQARDDVLVDHKWNFAQRTSALALVSGESAEKWGYAYAYPAKALYVHKVYLDGAEDINNPDPFEIKQGESTKVKVILTDVETASCDYTFQVTEPSQFSSKFCTALSYYLASLMAGVLVGKEGKEEALLKQYEYHMNRARMLNAGEISQNPDRTSALESVRS